MIRIGIFTCSNVTQHLGCCSASCPDDLRRRRGAFAVYPEEEAVELVEIAHCPGCPTAMGLERPIHRLMALAELSVHTIHLSSCFAALCPFKERFLDALELKFPEVGVISGTHGERHSHNEFWTKLKNTYIKPRADKASSIGPGAAAPKSYR